MADQAAGCAPRASRARWHLWLRVATTVVAAASFGLGTIIVGSGLVSRPGGFDPPSLGSIAMSRTVDCRGLGFSVERPDGYAIVPDATADLLESHRASRVGKYRLSFVATDSPRTLTSTVRITVLQLDRDTTGWSDQQLRSMPAGISAEYRDSHSPQEVMALLGDRNTTLMFYALNSSVREFRTTDNHLALPVRNADTVTGPGSIIVFHGPLVLKFSFAVDSPHAQFDDLRRFAETARLYPPDNPDAAVPRSPHSPVAQC
ncbi:MAG: hypothetical protein HKP61_03025 [Dactylosporangium sp.]|nr:hypothetical protein [Dactylosporangium sp.]NNJ59928.1 hypothetical protein [Dactylosporangium sp.]